MEIQTVLLSALVSAVVAFITVRLQAHLSVEQERWKLKREGYASLIAELKGLQFSFRELQVLDVKRSGDEHAAYHREVETMLSRYRKLDLAESLSSLWIGKDALSAIANARREIHKVRETHVSDLDNKQVAAFGELEAIFGDTVAIVIRAGRADLKFGEDL